MKSAVIAETAFGIPGHLLPNFRAGRFDFQWWLRFHFQECTGVRVKMPPFPGHDREINAATAGATMRFDFLRQSPQSRQALSPPPSGAFPVLCECSGR